ALFYFLFDDNSVTIETLAGEKRQLELPDASVVVVNALSQISYSSDSWEDNRIIELEGEAFFDVTKGNSFDVKTPAGTVSVLGTEFNVKQRTDFFEVKCFEGSVQVVSPTQEKILKAGEHFRLSGNRLELGQNDYPEPQWTNNISSFRNLPLIEVMAELERQYAIDVNMSETTGKILFTGGFEHGDLENALESITEPLDLSFKFETTNQVSIHPREQ
ncbi:MAG: FecR family protein, partial [Flavobacteriaceae bacterium]